MICNIFGLNDHPPPTQLFLWNYAIEQFLLKAAGSFRKIEAGFVAGSVYLFILGPTKIGFYNFSVF